MTKITVQLLKKRAEHNDKNLKTLQEITLHQFDIEKIELIGDYCKRLKILYLQSNLIAKMENLHKLKELEYLNLALNNIECIDGVNKCESLTKLDLTVNFIDCDKLQESILHLVPCKNLKDLYLTGNPCSLFENYREFVIHLLPQLQKLDGKDITKTERIKARQSFSETLQKLKRKAQEIAEKKKQRRENIKNGKETIDTSSHCPEARIENYIQDTERKEQERLNDEQNKTFKKPPDPIQQAHDKMNQLVIESPNGELPKQRNLMKLKFEMDDNYGKHAENVRMIIEAPKFVDTSQMIVDIHPLWMQAQIKSHLLLLHLPCEVIVNKSVVRRIQSTGWLELIMPKSNWEIKITPTYVKKTESSNENILSDNKHEMSVDHDTSRAANYKSVMDDLENTRDNNPNWDFDESEVPQLE